MTWLWMALKGAKHVPWWAWVAAAVASAIAVHLHNDGVRESRAYAAGRASLQAEARASIAEYSTAMNAQVAKRDSAIAQTKRAQITVRQTARQYTQARDTTPVDSIPTSVRVLLARCDSMASAATHLDSAIVTERVITDTLVAIDTAQVKALSVDNTALRSRNRELEKRPTRKKATAIAILSAIVAALTTYGATR